MLNWVELSENLTDIFARAAAVKGVRALVSRQKFLTDQLDRTCEAEIAVVGSEKSQKNWMRIARSNVVIAYRISQLIGFGALSDHWREAVIEGEMINFIWRSNASSQLVVWYELPQPSFCGWLVTLKLLENRDEIRIEKNHEHKWRWNSLQAQFWHWMDSLQSSGHFLTLECLSVIVKEFHSWTVYSKSPCTFKEELHIMDGSLLENAVLQKSCSFSEIEWCIVPFYVRGKDIFLLTQL